MMMNSNDNQPQYQPQQPVYIVQQAPKRNGIGTAGFVLALLSLLFSWVPMVDFVLWFLGFLFSFIGLFKRPRGLAVAGFILSFISIAVILILVFVVGLALFANLNG